MYAGTASGHIFPPYVVYIKLKICGVPGQRVDLPSAGTIDQKAVGSIL